MATENLKERKIYRILTNSASKAWDKIAFWTTAKSVDAADGNNLETKVGAIKGITTSTSTTTTGYAADATVIKTLNDSLGMKLRINNGAPQWSARGADTWNFFKSDFATSLSPRSDKGIVVPANNIVTTIDAYRDDIMCIFILSSQLSEINITNANKIYEMNINDGSTVSSLSFHLVTSDKPTVKSTHRYNNCMCYVLKPK